MRISFAHLGLLVSVGLALAGCPSQPTELRFDTGVDAARGDSGGGGTDAGHDATAPGADTGLDAASASDAGNDAFVATDDAAMDDAGMDAATIADAGSDAASVVDAFAPPDTGADAGPVTCASAGGMCVALTPTSCPAPGMVGDARHYTCGSGLGTECCLPGACPTAPACTHVGTPEEGWYAADGSLICTNACSGLTTVCQHVGTAQQGWYAAGHGCMGRVNEVLNDRTCCP